MTKRLRVVSSLLALSTAIVALPAFAQDAGAVSFQLDGSGGVVGFNLPSYDSGIGKVVGGNLLGGMISGKLSAKLGAAQGWDVVLGLKGFGAFGFGGTSSTQRLTGSGTISGLDSGGGTIVLGTPGDDGDSVVTGPGGGVAQSHVTGGPSNATGVTPDGTGFAFSAVTSDGTNGNAYGGIGSSSGGRFVYDGPIDLTTSVTRSVFYSGADLTIGLNGSFDSATNVEVYAGPSFRLLGQGYTTAYTVDIPEVPGAATPITIPTFTLAINDNLMSTYVGGVIGGNVSFKGGDNIVFTLGAEGGAYTVHSSWEAHDTYSTCCGLTGTPQSIPSPTISVDGPSHKSDLGTTVAFAAEGNGSATMAIDENKSVTIGGRLGYLSYVPTLNRAGGVLTFGSSAMVTYGVSVGLTGHF